MHKGHKLIQQISNHLHKQIKFFESHPLNRWFVLNFLFHQCYFLIQSIITGDQDTNCIYKFLGEKRVNGGKTFKHVELPKDFQTDYAIFNTRLELIQQTRSKLHKKTELQIKQIQFFTSTLMRLLANCVYSMSFSHSKYHRDDNLW